MQVIRRDPGDSDENGNVKNPHGPFGPMVTYASREQAVPESKTLSSDSDRRVSVFWSWTLSSAIAVSLLIFAFWFWEEQFRGDVPMWAQIFLPGIALAFLWKFAGEDAARSFYGVILSKRATGPLALSVLTSTAIAIWEFSSGISFNLGDFLPPFILLSAALFVPYFALFYVIRRTSGISR